MNHLLAIERYQHISSSNQFAKCYISNEDIYQEKKQTWITTSRKQINKKDKNDDFEIEYNEDKDMSISV